MQRNGTVENKMFNVGKTGYNPKKIVGQWTSLLLSLTNSQIFKYYIYNDQVVVQNVELDVFFAQTRE